MICWFEFGFTDSVPGALTPINCLGWLPGSACPHYDKETERRPSFHRLIAEGAIPGGYAADDGVSLHFVNDALARVISARLDARAYRLERNATRLRRRCHPGSTRLKLPSLQCGLRDLHGRY